MHLTTLALPGTLAGEAGDGSNPGITKVKVFMTRPGTELQQAVMATSIISYMKAIKIWRIKSGHPHLDLDDAAEYGAVMDLQGCCDVMQFYQS